MSCKHCLPLSRRDFLGTAAGGGALAAVLAACGDGEISGIGRRGALPRPLQITVANFPDLAINDRLVKVGDAVAAKRTGPATFAAFDMTCTHQGCLTEITAGGTLFDCPCHGSRFDANGAVVRTPAQRPLGTLTTSYNPSTDTLTIS